MSFLLPPSGSPVRELFNVADLALDLSGARSATSAAAVIRGMPTVPQAIRAGRAYLAQDDAAKAVNSLCVNYMGDLILKQVTRRSHKTLWNFGH